MTGRWREPTVEERLEARPYLQAATFSPSGGSLHVAEDRAVILGRHWRLLSAISLDDPYTAEWIEHLEIYDGDDAPR